MIIFTSNMLFVWIKFIICSTIILLAGSQLTRYADVIAEKTGLTRAWIGLVLLALITSIPELANGISAVTGVGMPDLAVGDIFGACLYNMLILAFLSMIWSALRKGNIYEKASTGHRMTGAFAILLIVIACIGIIFSRFFPETSILGIGPFTIIIALVYLIAQRSIYIYEKKTGELETFEGIGEGRMSLGRAAGYFVFFSVFVVAAGSWLPYIGKDISFVMGWDGTFVGSMFLGLATTLPELVVSISALLLGSVNMAIGNLFGSDLFNVSLLFIIEIFFVEKSLFAYVSLANLFFGLVVIAAIGLGVLALTLKPEKKVLRVLGWDSLGIIALYIFGVYLLYSIGIRF